MPLYTRNGQDSKISGFRREIIVLIYMPCLKLPPRNYFQPWRIYSVEPSLAYAKDRLEISDVALKIAINYATIKEWYYLVNEQERYSEDGQLQSNDKAYGEGGECFLVGK